MVKSGFFRRFLRKKRKYPIKKNKYGWSNRYRALMLFDQGMTPAQVASGSDGEVSVRTARRYYSCWKKLPRGLEEKYRRIRKAMKRYPEYSEMLLKNVADQLGLPLDELKQKLEKPWSFKRLITTGWPEQADKSEDTSAAQDKYKQWSRLKTAIMLIYLYEVRGVPGERILEELDMLDRQYHRPKAKKEEASDGS